MKKIYIKPVNKVRELSMQEGILLVTSDDNMASKGFDTKMSNDVNEGDGGDYARENNRIPSIWDQGW